jgi:hypothetical protein
MSLSLSLREKKTASITQQANEKETSCALGLVEST